MLKRILAAVALAAALGGVAVGTGQAQGEAGTQVVVAGACIGVGCGG